LEKFINTKTIQTANITTYTSPYTESPMKSPYRPLNHSNSTKSVRERISLLKLESIPNESILNTSQANSAIANNSSRIKGIDYNKMSGRKTTPKQDSDYYPSIGAYNPNYNLIQKSYKKSKRIT
jgi:hypothetical protein